MKETHDLNDINGISGGRLQYEFEFMLLSPGNCKQHLFQRVHTKNYNTKPNKLDYCDICFSCVSIRVYYLRNEE